MSNSSWHRVNSSSCWLARLFSPGAIDPKSVETQGQKVWPSDFYRRDVREHQTRADVRVYPGGRLENRVVQQDYFLDLGALDVEGDASSDQKIVLQSYEQDLFMGPLRVYAEEKDSGKEVPIQFPYGDFQGPFQLPYEGYPGPPIVHSFNVKGDGFCEPGSPTRFTINLCDASFEVFIGDFDGDKKQEVAFKVGAETLIYKYDKKPD